MSELIESQQLQSGLKGPFQEQQQQPTEDPSSQGNEIDAEMFSKKKNQFRVEIRKKQIKLVLQAKRNKTISWFSSNPNLFHAELPNQTFNEFQASSPDLELIKKNLHVIDQAVSDMQDNAAQLVKQSPLFNKLVDMITWGRNQPFEAFEAAYNIVLNVTANVDCIDVVNYVAEKLLCEDQNGKIDAGSNNQLYYNPETRAGYRLSCLEDHLSNDQDIDIRQNAINLLANISAEPSEFSRKAILSKAQLFPIILENIELKNYNDTVLECIVNLISNLSLNSQWYTYQDFNDLPELLNSVLLLLPHDSYQQQAALTAFEAILSIADDDDIHSLVNENYSILTTIYRIIQSSNLNTDNGYNIVYSSLEILLTICDWTESLTQQAVDMGLFDPIAFLILNDAPKRLTVLSLELLAKCFAKKSSSIHEIFLNDHTFNENQALTRKLITLANMSQKDIKNAALEAIGELLLSASFEQCKEIFQDSRLIRTFLDALSSDAVETDNVSLILESLCNLIFMGNLYFSVEENPYTLDFLAKNGFAVLDAISETLPNEAFSHSDRLISLLVDGNIDFSQQ